MENIEQLMRHYFNIKHTLIEHIRKSIEEEERSKFWQEALSLSQLQDLSNTFWKVTDKEIILSKDKTFDNIEQQQHLSFADYINIDDLFFVLFGNGRPGIIYVLNSKNKID